MIEGAREATPTMIRHLVVALIRRYPAPILERCIVGLGLLATLAQTLLIVWILS